MQYGSFRRHIWALPLEIIMAAGGVAMILQQDWFHLTTCIFTTLISFLPLWFERVFKVYLPSGMQFTFVAFVFASMFCGEVLYFYRNVTGWDELMHGISGVLVGFGVILWLRYLLRRNKKIAMPIWFQVLFVICFNSLVAISWESVEFMSDQLFGTSSQDRSLFDTMTDLIYGTLGSILVAIIYRGVLLGKSIPVLSRAIITFEKANH